MSNPPTENTRPPESEKSPTVSSVSLPGQRPPSARSPRRRRTVIVIAAAAVVLLGVVWWVNHRTAAEAGGAARGGRRGGGGPGGGDTGPLPVSVRAAEKGNLDLYLDGLGTVTPLHTVMVRTQISGHLEQIAFEEGQLVHQGDLLAVIDPRPYQVALEQAQGQLHQAQSQLQTAQLDLARYDTLAQQDSIAKQQVDATRSQVAQYEGLVQTDQAAIDSANLNLTYCHIKAPVDGRVGLRLIDQGNYVTPGDTNGLVVLTQTKPITVIFTLPEDNVTQVSARLHSGAKLPVEAFNRTQTTKLATGTLTTIDNQIDTSTGTFRLRAEFANEDESLFPNQFVNVRLLVDSLHDAVVIPTSAVERSQQGTFVYLVKPDSTVATRPVKLGPTEGERVAVTDGLAVGEQVVTDGADRLRDGMKVIPHNAANEAGAAHGAGGTSGTGRPHRHRPPTDDSSSKQ